MRNKDVKGCEVRQVAGFFGVCGKTIAQWRVAASVSANKESRIEMAADTIGAAILSALELDSIAPAHEYDDARRKTSGGRRWRQR